MLSNRFIQRLDGGASGSGGSAGSGGDGGGSGGGTYMCETCLSYRPIGDFHVTSASTSIGRCKACIKRDNDAHPRIDYGFYKVLLRQLREEEEKFDDDSRICHLIKVVDGDSRICHLIKVVDGDSRICHLIKVDGDSRIVK